MFGFIRQKLNERREKKSVQKYLKNIFEPRKEFLENSRSLFLSEITNRPGATFGAPVRIMTRHLFLKYAAGMAGVLLFATSAASAYADQTDVSPESPLYPLKKLSENVQLTVASNEKKIALYEKFAERRVKEIGEINDLIGKKTEKEKEKANKAKEKIKNDFKDKIVKIEEREKNEVEELGGIATSSDIGISPALVRSRLCNLDFKNVENGEGEEFWKKSEKLEKFKEKCDKLRENMSKQENDDKEDDIKDILRNKRNEKQNELNNMKDSARDDD